MTSTYRYEDLNDKTVTDSFVDDYDTTTYVRSLRSENEDSPCKKGITKNLFVKI